jgi:hypothetical protein
MAKRNTSRPLRFVCITDDVMGLVPGIETKPMWPFDLPEFFRFRPFRRMFVWNETLYDLEGDVLHFDLDLLIVGSIDDFFDYEQHSSFCVAENWTQPGQMIGNMSVFRFRVGSHPYLWHDFQKNPMLAYETYRNSQTYVSRRISELTFYPSSWCQSFKHSLMPRWPLNFVITPPLPKGTKVVAFTGKPDPDEAMVGVWPTKRWYQKLYKRVRPTPWIAEHWR